MSDSPLAATPLLARRELMIALANETRLAILKALCAGEPLGVVDLAPIAGCTRGAVSKHMFLMSQLGIVVRGRGNLYRIPAHFQPTPGKPILDFGHCLLRLDAAQSPAS